MIGKLLIPIGGLLGALSGYIHYLYIGCNGTCPISANPLGSIIYGSIVGSLIFSFFKKDSSS